MKKEVTVVRAQGDMVKTRLWCKFSTKIDGRTYFFKVTTRLKGSTIGSPLVLTECSTGGSVCDVTFAVIAETRVSEQENDYIAAGKKALKDVLAGGIDFGRSIDRALQDIEREEAWKRFDDEIPF